jgi:DNA mismatch endonuclease (patch repair protein)
MADIFDKKKRSALMSRIRSSGNATTELRFIVMLKSGKITGWRRNYSLFGKPDFVFPKTRLVVFIDGCFWHGCSFCYAASPKSNTSFWKQKFARNKERDLQSTRILRSLGWRVLRIWEHELSRKNENAVRRRVRRALGR